MATTIPFRFADFYPAAATEPMSTQTFREKLDTLVKQYECALADSDESDIAEDIDFYDGQVDALIDALSTLLDIPEGELEKYFHT